MRPIHTAVLFVSLAAAPAFSQNNPDALTSSAAAGIALPSGTTDASVDYLDLKGVVARQNKLMTEQVTQQRASFRRNRELLKEAQKINSANLRLAEEHKKLDVELDELEKQRTTLKSAQKSEEIASK